MAVFFTDFEEHPTQSGVPTGWSTRWSAANVAYSIVEIGGAKALRIFRQTDQERGLSWDVPGTAVGDSEIAVRCRYTQTTGSSFGTERNTVLLRGGGNNVNNSVGYIATAWTHGTPSQRFVQLRQLATDFAGATMNLGVSGQIDDIQPNQWFWIRMRAEGSTILTKFWLDGNPEPSNWMVTATNRTANPTGFIGICARGTLNGTQHWEFDRVGVGTAGDSAPTEVASEPVEMDASDLGAGAFVDAGEFRIGQSLVGTDLGATASLDPAAFAVAQSMPASDLSASAALDPAELRAERELEASDLEATATLGAAEFLSPTNLHATELAAGAELDAANFTQPRTLTASHLTASTTLDPAEFIAVMDFPAVELEATAALDPAELSIGHSLFATDLVAHTAADPAALAVDAVLTATDLGVEAELLPGGFRAFTEMYGAAIDAWVSLDSATFLVGLYSGKMPIRLQGAAHTHTGFSGEARRAELLHGRQR